MAKTDPQVNIRIPTELKRWLDREKKRNASTLNSEITRAVRERMERQEPATRAA